MRLIPGDAQHMHTLLLAQCINLAGIGIDYKAIDAVDFKHELTQLPERRIIHFEV